MKTKSLFALLLACIAGTVYASYDDDDRYYEQNRDKLISYEKARDIAAKEVGGYAEDVDFEYELGRAVFEVDVRKENQEYNVKIDAKTGKVLSARRDY